MPPRDHHQQSPHMAREEPAFEEVPPDPSAMIESMRAYGYTLSTAVADLIDNSIAANASHVWIRHHWAGADSWIAIADDGDGMDEVDLRNAMRLGSRSPLEKRDREDLGRFGLGLKTASLSQCRRLTVRSTRDDGEAWTRRWDLDYLANNQAGGWRLLTTCAPGSEERLSAPEESGSGTVVLWELLDRLVGDAGKDNKKVHDHFLRLIDDLEAHLAMVFHRFLASGGRRLSIQLNDVAIRPWDPFVENHGATTKTPEEVITVPGFRDPVRVRGFVLPHKDRLGDKEHRAASGPAGWNAQQGFYLYRNERLIVAGSWLGLGGARPWTQEEHYKLCRIRLDVPNSMDHLWQLDVKKSSAVPPPVVADRLTGLAQKVRTDARAVFAHRGSYGKRTDRREYAKPWKATTRSGVRTYRIDRSHPLIKAVADVVSDVAKEEFEAALRIIEETVPVEQIWLDKAEAPEDFAAPFHGSTSRQLRHLIELAYRAIRRNRGTDHADTVRLLSESVEFAGSEAQAILASLEDPS